MDLLKRLVFNLTEIEDQHQAHQFVYVSMQYNLEIECLAAKQKKNELNLDEINLPVLGIVCINLEIIIIIIIWY